MKRATILLAALALVSMFASDAEACRRRNRGGCGCGCHMEVVDAASQALPAGN